MTDYTAPMWDQLRQRKLADGWPMPGDQEDGSYVEWASNPRAYEPTHYIRHDNYFRYIFSRPNKEKQRLACKIYLGQGGDETDKAAVLAFVNKMTKHKLGMAVLKERYAEALTAYEQSVQ